MNKPRQEGHIAEKGKICPNCGSKDCILYWKRVGCNRDLMGNEIDNMKRIKPTCTKCGKVYSKGTLFRCIR